MLAQADEIDQISQTRDRKAVACVIENLVSSQVNVQSSGNVCR